MAKCLRTLAVLTKNQCLFFSTLITVHNCLLLQFLKIQFPLLASWDTRYTHGGGYMTCSQKHIHIK